MTLKDVEEILGAQLAWTSDCPGCGDREVRSCHASDLMSDVLTLRGPGSLLLTGLTNTHVIRTAEISEFVAVCFVRGKKPQPDAVQMAEDKGIPLYVTPLSMYESSGRLYAKGLPSGHGDEGLPDCQAKK